MISIDALALLLRQKGYTYKVIAKECRFADQSGAYKAVKREMRRNEQSKQ